MNKGPLTDYIDELRRSFQQALAQATTTKDVEALRVHYLGKKGPVTALMQKLKECSPEERPESGKRINALKEFLQSEIEKTSDTVLHSELEAQIEGEGIDIFLPGRTRFVGRMHPITQAVEDMLSILESMGFSIYQAPEIESDYYNYGALNYPADHPASPSKS